MIGDASRLTEDKKASLQKVRELSRSFVVGDSIIEGLDTDLSFPTLRAEAAKLPTSKKSERPLAVYDAILYRSARHSVTNGVFAHTKAVRGRYRALYEGARLFHILKTK